LKKASDTCRIIRAKGQINGFNSAEDMFQIGTGSRDVYIVRKTISQSYKKV
jgi:hypothetical protein